MGETDDNEDDIGSKAVLMFKLIPVPPSYIEAWKLRQYSHAQGNGREKFDNRVVEESGCVSLRCSSLWERWKNKLYKVKETE